MSHFSFNANLPHHSSGSSALAARRSMIVTWLAFVLSASRSAKLSLVPRERGNGNYLSPVGVKVTRYVAPGLDKLVQQRENWLNQFRFICTDFDPICRFGGNGFLVMDFLMDFFFIS